MVAVQAGCGLSHEKIKQSKIKPALSCELPVSLSGGAAIGTTGNSASTISTCAPVR